MKNLLLFVVHICIVLTALGQNIDKQAEYYFSSAFLNQPAFVSKAIADDSARMGVFIVTEIIVDTLNKHELIKLPPPKDPIDHSVIKVDGREVRTVVAHPGYSGNSRPEYDMMSGMAAVHGDTCLLMAVSRTPYFPKSMLCGFRAMIRQAGVVSTKFYEEALDSAAIYRSTASFKKLSRIEVNASLSNCFFSKWPTSKTGPVYGGAVMITDAFYAQDDNFTSKYILKRYTISLVFRSPVQVIK
jgi:hypothetical protein